MVDSFIKKNDDSPVRNTCIMKRTALVIEDNKVTAQTLEMFLASTGFKVKKAHDGPTGLMLFDNMNVDVVILDLMLPGINGIEVCKKIRAKSEAPIVILSAKTSEDEIVMGLEAGANDYVCKPYGARELLARIKRCCANTSQQKDEVFSCGEITLNLINRTTKVNQRPLKLTKSEFEILSLFIQNKGRVFTREQIIRHIYGDDNESFDRTIDTHIWSLRKKIGEKKGNPRYIHSEMGVGYRFRDGNEY